MPSVSSELLSYSGRCGLNRRSSNVQAVATTCEATLGKRAAPNAAAISVQRALMLNVPNVMSRSPQTSTSAGIAAPMFPRPTNGMPDDSLELSGLVGVLSNHPCGRVGCEVCLRAARVRPAAEIHPVGTRRTQEHVIV